MLSTFMKKLVDDTSGATAVEYGLIAALIVVAMIAALSGVADSTILMWENVENRSTTAITA
ncbi:MAG: Flp family type IVb pilin [Porphyrobacter sp. IPPAS B-1204]|nr:MAG: Flp family type IVb pilin [Porphyrobacter sp. IPPAS B-1204]